MSLPTEPVKTWGLAPSQCPPLPGKGFSARGLSPFFHKLTAYVDVGRIVRAPVRALDGLLRRHLHIEEFSTHPHCVFRVALQSAPAELRFSDGTRVGRGDPIGMLHFWNEHVPRLPSHTPTLSWAAAGGRLLRQSLGELAAFVESDPRYREVLAFGGDTAVFDQRAARTLHGCAGRLGFESFPVPRPTGAVARMNRLGEDLLLAALLWTYNPACQRGRALRRNRCRIFISRNTLMARYKTSSTTTADSPGVAQES